jgi:hypothetical protein
MVNICNHHHSMECNIIPTILSIRKKLNNYVHLGVGLALFGGFPK